MLEMDSSHKNHQNLSNFGSSQDKTQPCLIRAKIKLLNKYKKINLQQDLFIYFQKFNLKIINTNKHTNNGSLNPQEKDFLELHLSTRDPDVVEFLTRAKHCLHQQEIIIEVEDPGNLPPSSLFGSETESSLGEISDSSFEEYQNGDHWEVESTVLDSLKTDPELIFEISKTEDQKAMKNIFKQNIINFSKIHTVKPIRRKYFLIRGNILEIGSDNNLRFNQNIR